MTTLLDTRVVPARDRSEYWSSGIAEHFFPIQVESVGSGSFDARLTGGQVGPLAVRSISGPSHRVARTSQMIRAADPECVLLYLLGSGCVRIEQDDRASIMRPGDIAIQDTSRPSTFESTVPFDVLVLSFPKWFIGVQANAIGRRAVTRMAGREEPFTRLVTPFIAGLVRAGDGGGVIGPEGDGAAEMLLAMLRTLYGDDGTDRASRSEMLLGRMRAYALAHLQDPELGPEQIAQAHFVSTRYVHKLFASTERGVSAWIREQRLHAALGELQGSSETSVAQVASRWGYRDPASFARAFRDQFGRTPTSVRPSS